MGPMLASVFSMQGFGQLAGCILVIILLSVCRVIVLRMYVPSLRVAH
jgi:hypothetical protein